MDINLRQHRFPFCIVWTPIPIISWICPFIGHMGICTSKGVIRDFAGSYYVSEDNMAFGWPTLYMQLSHDLVDRGAENWDRSILMATEEYRTHIHNLFCDNCHSFVSLALNKMEYADRTDWNMFRIGLLVICRGRFTGFTGFLRQYLPTTLILFSLLSIIFLTTF